MSFTTSIAAAHLIGFIGAWLWFAPSNGERQAPTNSERKQWALGVLAALVVEQALLAINWHLPLMLSAGGVGGFLAVILQIGYPTVGDDLDDDDTPMSYAEAKRLSIAAATCGGCVLAFAALLWLTKH